MMLSLLIQGSGFAISQPTLGEALRSPAFIVRGTTDHEEFEFGIEGQTLAKIPFGGQFKLPLEVKNSNQRIRLSVPGKSFFQALSLVPGVNSHKLRVIYWIPKGESASFHGALSGVSPQEIAARISVTLRMVQCAIGELSLLAGQSANSFQTQVTADGSVWVEFRESLKTRAEYGTGTESEAAISAELLAAMEGIRSGPTEKILGFNGFSTYDSKNLTLLNQNESVKTQVALLGTAAFSYLAPSWAAATEAFFDRTPTDPSSIYDCSGGVLRRWANTSVATGAIFSAICELLELRGVPSITPWSAWVVSCFPKPEGGFAPLKSPKNENDEAKAQLGASILRSKWVTSTPEFIQ